MSRDLRKYAHQTNIQLAAGALFVLFIVGDGLIYLFYGGGAALLGLLCLLAGMVPVILTVLVLLLLDWIRKRADPD
jgi:TM2 domain-containing membrane protein YozV